MIFFLKSQKGYFKEVLERALISKSMCKSEVVGLHKSEQFQRFRLLAEFSCFSI